ncbi:MAG: T9SS type A sorting domain-containing protein [Saprospiraceae bacterium]|nr:T9SS type A sorting domain-containing protein [Saprospiraceae bacterium]
MAAIMFLLPSLRQDLAAQGTFCGYAIDVTIGSENVSDIFPGGGTWPSGTILNVTGVLTIDQSITLNGLTFLMSPGARIVAQGSGVVASIGSGTQMLGCSALSMWGGIRIQNGASIEMVGARIEDAWIALHFTSNANIAGSILSGNFLYDNMIGIYFIGPGLFRPAVFAGNVIKRDIGPILPPPPGVTYDGSLLWMGMVFGVAKVDIASNASARNEISGYRRGIYVNNATMTIANCSFNNNAYDATAGDAYSGTDIFTNNSTVAVGGAGNQNCVFFNAYTSSILSRSTRGLSVSGARFNSPQRYGINCIKSINLTSPIRVTNNIFHLNGAKTISGIFVERPPSGPETTNTLIRQNSFVVDGGHPKDSMLVIDVLGKVDAFDAAEISANSIEVTRTWPRIHGIRIAGKGNNYNVIDKNLLSWKPSAPPTATIAALRSLGIIAQDLMGSNNFIIDNDIWSKLDDSNGKSYLKAGIQLSNNPFSLWVCENRLEENHHNLFCGGSLGNTRLVRNLIGDAGYGLYCRSDASLPDQDRFENRWVGSTYVNRGAEYQGGSPGFLFFYDDDNTIPDDKPITVLPTSGWFFSLEGSNNVCGVGGVVITEKEWAFLDSTSFPNAETDNWDTRRLLLYKLMRHAEIVSEEPTAANYLSANETAETSPWRFAYAENLFDQAYSLSNSLNAAFANTGNHFQALLDSIAILDELQAQDTTTFDTQIAQQRADVFDLLAVAADSLQQLREQAYSTVLPALQSALTYAQSLPDTQDYEKNLKDILVIAIRHARGDSLEESDYGTLRDIAAQCPAIGGISVRRAPLWLAHGEGVDYLDKDWDENCGIRPLAASETKTPVGIRVMPNPADGQVEVLFPANTTGRWQLRDMSGRIVREGNISSSSLRIGTGTLSQGLYLLNCQFSSGDFSTTKISIAH